MKRKLLMGFGLSLLVGASVLFSCTKDNKAKITTTSQAIIPSDVLKSISNLGFSTDQVRKQGNGYLVEGDILLTQPIYQKPAAAPRCGLLMLSSIVPQTW